MFKIFQNITVSSSSVTSTAPITPTEVQEAEPADSTAEVAPSAAQEVKSTDASALEGAATLNQAAVSRTEVVADQADTTEETSEPAEQSEVYKLETLPEGTSYEESDGLVTISVSEGVSPPIVVPELDQLITYEYLGGLPDNAEYLTSIVRSSEDTYTVLYAHPYAENIPLPEDLSGREEQYSVDGNELLHVTQRGFILSENFPPVEGVSTTTELFFTGDEAPGIYTATGGVEEYKDLDGNSVYMPYSRTEYDANGTIISYNATNPSRAYPVKDGLK